MVDNKKKCFVIMPFSDTASCNEQKWTDIFEHIIQPAVEECGLGYDCIRFELGRANIVKDILEELNRAQVVIADLTDNNANVLWELGVRHTLRRRTILIAQDKKFLPSDLKDYPLIPYDQTKIGFDKFKKDIIGKLNDIEANPDKSDSPVADFLGLKNIDLLAYEKSANLKKLSALISEISFNIDTVDSLMENVKANKLARGTDKQDNVGYSNNRLINDCLVLLLSTSYVTLPEKFQSLIRGINSSIMMLNIWLSRWANDASTKQTEELFEEVLPKMNNSLIEIMKLIFELRNNYSSDNYTEPETPVICLSKQEHGEYLRKTE